MTDHQGLTDKQLETLRSLPCDSLPTAEVSRLFDLGLATGVAQAPCDGQSPGVYWRTKRTEQGNTLLETLDHHTTKAKEDERRKFENFDFLCDFAAKYLDRHHPSDVPLICDPDSPDPGPRLAAALRDCLAATQSTPKGSES